MQERVRNDLSCTQLQNVVKIPHIDNKKGLHKPFNIFTKDFTHLLKTSKYSPQGFQIKALQQRYSPLKSKKPYIRGEIENNFQPNPNFLCKKKNPE